jgi:hypothetical protein
VLRTVAAATAALVVALVVTVLAGGTPVPKTISATAGQPFSGEVAQFTGMVCPCTATINWGDGSSSAGSATGSGTVTVTGAHTWASAGTFAVTVTASPSGGAPAPQTANSTANVAAAGGGGGGAAPPATTTGPPTATIPDQPPPTAGFSFFPAAPIAGQTVFFDASKSTGSNLQYSWSFCPGCAEGATGTAPRHAFPFAPVHDEKRFPDGIDPERRRTTTLVTLKVTDNLGRTAAATRYLTMLPDTPPLASYVFGAAGFGFSSQTFVPTVSDPDQPADAVVSVRWDLTNDGKDDLVCFPTTTGAPGSCKLTDQAGGTTSDEPVDPPLEFVTGPAKDFKPEDKPIEQEGIDLGINLDQTQGQSIAIPGGRRRSARGLRSVGPPKLALDGRSFLVLPQAKPGDFPLVTWDFARVRLAQVGLLPMIDQDLPHDAANVAPNFFTAADVYDALKTRSDAVRGAINGGKPEVYQLVTANKKNKFGLPDLRYYRKSFYPWQTRLTALDRSAVPTEIAQRIGYVRPQPPTAKARYVPADPDHALAQGTAVRVDTSGQVPPADQGDVVDVCGDSGPQACLTKGRKLKWYMLKVTRTPDDADKTPLVIKDVAFDPAQLSFTWPKAGVYTIRFSVVDELGLAAHSEIRGLTVLSTDKTCSPKSVTMKGTPFVASGSCIIANGDKTVQSTGPMVINGTTFTPTGANGTLFLDHANSKQPAKLTGLSGAFPGPVDITVDGSPVAHFAKLDAETGAALLAGAYGPEGPPMPDAKAGALRGLAVADGSSHLVFGPEAGASVLTAVTLLPAAFGGATTNQTIPGYTPPQKEGKVTVESGVGARRRAHAAETAECPGGGENMLAPGGLDIAGVIGLDGQDGNPGVRFCYEKPTDTYTADVDTKLPIPGGDALPTAHVKVVIRAGQLQEISGLLTFTGFPGPPQDYLALGSSGVAIKNFNFTLLPVPDDPLISVGSDFAVVGLLDGHAQISLWPKRPRFLLTGSFSLTGGLQLGSGYVDIGPAAGGGTKAAFGGDIGTDFGPASIHVVVSGGIASTPTGVKFFVAGEGEACLFACLDVATLISNEWLAACGGIDLGFYDVQAGLSFHLPDKALDLFGGSCDLDPYKPAAFAGSGAARAAAFKPLGPGGKATFTVEKQAQIAVKVLGDPHSELAPVVTLEEPGASGRDLVTPAAPGEYAFGGGTIGKVSVAMPRQGGSTQLGTALVDANPLDHSTTYLIAKPRGGTWTLTVAQGSAEVIDVRVAGAAPPIDVKKLVVGVGKLDKQTRTSAAKKLLARLPAIEESRVRAVSYDLPKGTRLTLLDVGAEGTTLLGTVGGTSRKGSIAFDPATDGGKHTLRGVVLGTNGAPRKLITLDKYTAPGPAEPQPAQIARVTRSGRTVSVLLDGDFSGYGKSERILSLDAKGSDGTRTVITVPRSRLRKAGSRWVLTLPGVSPHASLSLSIRNGFQGRVGKADKAVAKPAKRAKKPAKKKPPKQH